MDRPRIDTSFNDDRTAALIELQRSRSWKQVLTSLGILPSRKRKRDAEPPYAIGFPCPLR